ncbi:MAG: pilus assembly PilX N-terminal domain-containing protein [Bacillota bacterium]
MSALNEKGIALPIVVAVTAIVTILGFTAAYLVESQASLNLHFINNKKALYYAEAGMYEYLWRLNKDSKFYEHDDDFIFDGGVPRVHDVPGGHYQLAIDDPATDRPVVTIRATGWPDRDPGNRSTIAVEVHKRQFVQHIYLSGEEQTPDGEEVWWITGDEAWGPLHTNGTLHIDGDPVFHDRVTYSVGIEERWGSNPVYEAGPPEKVAPLVFPASNSQLKTQALLNGYYYNGRTCILLNGDQVVIRHRDGAAETRPLPPNGVIYVDGSTSGSKWDLNTGNAFVSGTLDGRLTIAAAKDVYITAKDPTNFNYDSAAPTGGVLYADADFDPEGGMTDDMLGLIAGGYVRILHYGWPHSQPPYYRNGNRDVAPYNITIHAALFALNWSFEYEDYDRGALKGVINLTGSITQKYRGAVGTFSSWSGNRLTGYNKHYMHDPRMLYDTPPHFLEPVNAGWEIVNWRGAPNP